LLRKDLEKNKKYFFFEVFEVFAVYAFLIPAVGGI